MYCKLAKRSIFVFILIALWCTISNLWLHVMSLILFNLTLKKMEGGHFPWPPGQNWDFFHTPWTKTGIFLTPRTQNRIFTPLGLFFSNSTPSDNFSRLDKIGIFSPPRQKRLFSSSPWTINRLLPMDIFFLVTPWTVFLQFYPPWTFFVVVNFTPRRQFCFDNFTPLGHFFQLILPPQKVFLETRRTKSFLTPLKQKWVSVPPWTHLPLGHFFLQFYPRTKTRIFRTPLAIWHPWRFDTPLGQKAISSPLQFF